MLTDLKPFLVYTMTAGLGDYLVMGDLIRKAERAIPGARVIILHRDNPHVANWSFDDYRDRFFNVHSLGELSRFLMVLHWAKREGFTRFGLQIPPGSIQGYLLHRSLRMSRLLEYVVDFNLINADIITPPVKGYILEILLRQLERLFHLAIDGEEYRLDLVVQLEGPGRVVEREGFLVGIHPWSRRGVFNTFVWPYTNWLDIMDRMLRARHDCKVVVFGKDREFANFKQYVESQLRDYGERIIFRKSGSVQELLSTVAYLDLLVSVNTGVVHAGYSMGKKMVILNGPSLDLWIPRGPEISAVSDEEAIFPGNDRWVPDPRMPMIQRITPDQVYRELQKYGF